jgi:hypothetical protein
MAFILSNPAGCDLIEGNSLEQPRGGIKDALHGLLAAPLHWGPPGRSYFLPFVFVQRGCLRAEHF